MVTEAVRSNAYLYTQPILSKHTHTLKEHGFFQAYLRDDLVLVEDDGRITGGQTLAEVAALVAVRYQEVHGRRFPYRTRRRRRRRGLREPGAGAGPAVERGGG